MKLERRNGERIEGLTWYNLKGEKKKCAPSQKDIFLHYKCDLHMAVRDQCQGCMSYDRNSVW